jgi:hypothetical protein
MSVNVVNTQHFGSTANNAWGIDIDTAFGITSTAVPLVYNTILEVSGDFNTLLTDVNIERKINGTNPATTDVTGQQAAYLQLQNLLLGTLKTGAANAVPNFSFAFRDPEDTFHLVTQESSRNFLEFWMYATSLALASHPDGSSVRAVDIQADLLKYQNIDGATAAEDDAIASGDESQLLEQAYNSLNAKPTGEQEVGTGIAAQLNYFRALMNFLLARYDSTTDNDRLTTDPDGNGGAGLNLQNNDTLGLQFLFPTYTGGVPAKVLILLHQQTTMTGGDWQDNSGNAIVPLTGPAGLYSCSASAL